MHAERPPEPLHFNDKISNQICSKAFSAAVLKLQKLKKLSVCHLKVSASQPRSMGFTAGSTIFTIVIKKIGRQAERRTQETHNVVVHNDAVRQCYFYYLKITNFECLPVSALSKTYDQSSVPQFLVFSEQEIVKQETAVPCPRVFIVFVMSV